MFGKNGEMGVYEACALGGGVPLNENEVDQENIGSLFVHTDSTFYWVDMFLDGTDLHNSSDIESYNKTRNYDNAKEGKLLCYSMDFFNYTKSYLRFRSCSIPGYAICQELYENIKVPLTLPSVRESSHRMKKRFLECPHGYNWKEDAKTGFCYWETSYETNRLSWLEARNYCQSYAGDLASFHHINEERIGLSFQYGSIIHPYWIGLIYDTTKQAYIWTDGSPLDYQNWAPGQPDHRNGRMRCVQMHASEKHWKVSYCGILSWFVCKAPKQIHPKVPELPKRIPLRRCSQDSLSYYFDGYCYSMPGLQYKWARAYTYCSDIGGDLLSIHSEDELDFLLRLLSESGIDTNLLWIGLRSNHGLHFHRNVDSWTDGTAMDFANWDNISPPSLYLRTYCGNMYASNGLWGYEDCEVELNFVCKWMNTSSGTGNTQDVMTTSAYEGLGNCQDGWLELENKCYLLVGIKKTERKSWHNASKICESLGGQLLSVHSEKQDILLSFLLQYTKSDVWIGLKNNIDHLDAWQWIDGSLLQHTNWARSQPSSNWMNERCVQAKFDNEENGQWEVEACHKNQPFICQSEKDQTITVPPSLPKFMRCIHPQGWIKLGSSCFKLYKQQTWSNAREFCRSLDADLVSISDSSVASVTQYLARDVSDSFWIGLIANADNEFQWVNNQTMTFSEWGSNQPDLSMQGPICCASLDNGYWNVTQCSKETEFICQVTGDTEPIKSDYQVACPDGYYDVGGDYCYYIEDKIMTNWHSSSFKCLDKGDYLASFHSMQELKQLQRKAFLTGDRTRKSFYIGLTTNTVGGFEWFDGSPVNFLNWYVSPLANFYKCVVMHAAEMKWEMVSCVQRHYYICGKSKASLKFIALNNTEEYAYPLKDNNSGLSGGALAAVIIFLLVAVVIAAVLGFVYMRNGHIFPFRLFPSHPDSVTSFENALFNPDAGLELSDKKSETESCD